MPGFVMSMIACSLLGTLRDQELDTICQDSAKAALGQFTAEKLAVDQIGLSIAVRKPDGTYRVGGFRDEEPMYPASVVKMFYLARAAERIGNKKLKLTPELDRAVKDMIVDSNNDATGAVLDAITQTTGGPELGPRDLAKWMEKRASVNLWLLSLGFTRVNCNQKTWNEGPYGRERQGYGPNFELRNSLTPASCTKMIAMILDGKIAPEPQTSWMKGYLQRGIPADGPASTADGQSRAYTGGILPKGFKLWSKAGWTSSVRMDVAMVEAPNGERAALAVFTKGQSNTAKLVPFLAKELLTRIGWVPGS